MDFEDLILQSDSKQLYCDIKQKSMVEKSLPINKDSSLIGFGKLDKYYMFWITRSGDDKFQFACRRQYIEDRSGANIRRILLTESNRAEIFECIENIYLGFCNTHPDFVFEPVQEDVPAINDLPSQNSEEGYYEFLIKDLQTSLTNLRSALTRRENCPIDMSLLNTRTRNVLLNYHITDYRILSECKAEEIIRWKWCGRKTVQNIIRLIDGFSCDGYKDKIIPVAPGSEKQKYYSTARVRALLDEKYYFDYKLSEEALDKFGNFAACIAEDFQNYLKAYKRNCLQDRDVDIFCDYTFDDAATMEAVGNNYKLTRERVRQILIKYRRRLKGGLYKSEFISYSVAINDVLSNIPDEAFVHFIAFAFLPQYSQRLSLFILQCLFDNDVAEAVIAAAESLIYKCAPINKLNGKVGALISKAIFPCESRTKADIADIEGGEEEAEFQYKEKFLLKLSQSSEIEGIVRNPKLVYYVTSSTTHTPDLCLQKKDGKLIFVLILPAINMAISYNLSRFSALHTYCKENGYGYLITDDRFNTILDIYNIEVNKDLSEALFQVLNKSGRIIWKNIKFLKAKFEITTSTLAAFILQNKLKFTMDPYVITRHNREPNSNFCDILPEIKEEGSKAVLLQPTEEVEPPSLSQDDEKEAEHKPRRISVKIGKYDFICDENGEILTDSGLFEELRKLRLSLAEAEDLPAYCFCSNSVLVSLATYKPTTEEDWLAIKGLGSVKFEKYGEQFLKLIKEYCNS